MKTRTLTQISPQDIFRDYDQGPWICASELRKRVDIPRSCSKIRLCLIKDKPDNDGWFRLNTSPRFCFDTPIRGIRASLTHNLKMWLYEGREEGYRYGYIDYES